jgi:hypothetical protein
MSMTAHNCCRVTGEKARVLNAFYDQCRWKRKPLHYHLGVASMHDEFDRMQGAIARKKKYLDMCEAGHWCGALEDLADLHGLPSHCNESAQALAGILRREIDEDREADLDLGGLQDCFWD